jgi:hypothetical protein
MLFREHDRLHSRNIKPLAAAHVFAGHHVVFAQHVGASFGKAGAVAFVGASRQLPLLGAHQPAYFIFGRLLAMRTVQICRFLLGTFVKKIAFFHETRSSILIRPVLCRDIVTGIVHRQQTQHLIITVLCRTKLWQHEGDGAQEEVEEIPSRAGGQRISSGTAGRASHRKSRAKQKSSP